jgi:hypothetical protein
MVFLKSSEGQLDLPSGRGLALQAHHLETSPWLYRRPRAHPGLAVNQRTASYAVLRESNETTGMPLAFIPERCNDFRHAEAGDNKTSEECP